MARLPGENYLIQQIGGQVVLFHDMTEEEIVRFDPTDANAAARAQFTIYSSDELNPEQKCFAHFWAGYFYAHSGSTPEGWDGPIRVNNVPFLLGEGDGFRWEETNRLDIPSLPAEVELAHRQGIMTNDTVSYIMDSATGMEVRLSDLIDRYNRLLVKVFERTPPDARVDTTHLHEHDQVRAEDMTYESGKH